MCANVEGSQLGTLEITACTMHDRPSCLTPRNPQRRRRETIGT